MDVRDFTFWASEAKRTRAERRILAMGDLRVANNAEANVYKDHVSAISGEADPMTNYGRRIESAWEQLKSQGKG